MAFLVTGGFGHIGGWVCQKLLERGEEVVVVSRSRRALSYLTPFDDRLRFASVEMGDLPSLYKVFREYDGRLSGVVHIAGIMGGPFFASKPPAHIQLNTMGTVNILEAARTFGVPRVVYVSSGAVYGPRDDVPGEDTPLAPGDLYGAAKAAAELFGLQYANEFGLDFRALRVYFAYGPGRLPGELYPLYNAVFGPLLGQGKIELPAGADQSIDFTYVKDIADAVLLLLDKNDPPHRRYNVTSGAWRPIPELVRAVAELAGVKLELNIGPGRIMPRGPSLDSSRIREELGFAPRYDLAAGLAEYLAWIKERA